MAHPKQMAAGAAAMPASAVKQRLLHRTITSPVKPREIVLDTEEQGRWYYERHGGTNWMNLSVYGQNEWRAHAERMKKVPVCDGCNQRQSSTKIV